MAGFDGVLPLMFVWSGCLWNRASRWGMDVVLCCHRCSSRVGARRIERLDGEWLVLMWCAATDVRLERVLVESSVYMGNGGF